MFLYYLQDSFAPGDLFLD